MADNTTLNTGSGGDTIATDDISGVKYPRSKIVLGANGTNDGDVCDTLPLPVKGTGTAGTANAGVMTVQGVASMTPIQVGDNSSTLSVDDGSGSLTVDNAALSVTGGGLEASAMRVTIASDSTGVLSVDDNGGNLSVDDGGGSLTVDGTVAISNSSIPVTDNSGSLTVDNGGTFAVQDSDKVADNAGFTDGTTKVLPAGFIYDEVAGTALTENDAGAARMDVKRAQVSVIEDETTRGRRATVTAANALKVDASGVAVPVTDNSGSLTVDNAGTFATQATLQAGTALIGQVSASPETGTIYSGTTALTPKFAKISCASSGENTIVALVSSKKIRVLSLCLVGVGTAVSIYFKDAASGTAIFADGTNPIPIDKSGAAGAGGLVLGYNPLGWFQSASGGALILNLSTAQAVAGSLTYCEV